MLNELKKYPSGPRDLSTCFEVFAILHRVLNKKSILERVTREILEDFNRENVVYLELRTTPREIFSDETKTNLVVSKREYLDTVISVIKEYELKNDMVVRLLLSIDRTKSVEDGLNTVQLCHEYQQAENSYVVGIDFSGNPKISSFKNMKSIFDLANKYGLKTTVHIAEHWDDPDLDFILKETRPARIGHAVCLTNEWKEFLLQNPIPIEICPTSNLITKCVEQIVDHPFYEFYRVNSNYPLVICTDDFGVFRTTLTNEYLLIASAFNLSFKEMFEISRKSIDFIFEESPVVLKKLRQKFDLY